MDKESYIFYIGCNYFSVSYNGSLTELPLKLKSIDE